VNIIKCEVALLFTRAAMSNPNGLVSQKLCHYLNRAAHWMAYYYGLHNEWLTL